MKEHFPLLDDYLRDLRNFLLSRVHFPHDDSEEMCKSIVVGVRAGIKKYMGASGLDDFD